MHKTEKLYRVSAVSIVLLVGLLIAGCQQKVESKPWEGSWIVSHWTTPDGEVQPVGGNPAHVDHVHARPRQPAE